MKRPFLRFVILGLVTALGGLAFSADQSQDESEIRNVMMALDEAWNHHDMKAFANQFAEDADQVNVAGWWWKGPLRSRGSLPQPTRSFFEKAPTGTMRFISNS
jgi:uncharacterized protein (TIGR02246 family)